MHLENYIYIDAYKQKNLGDDLFLHIIFRRYPDIRFLFPADEEYQNILKNYKNVRILTKKTIDRKMKFFNKYRNHKKNLMKEYITGCRAAVYIGGSIFQEPKIPMLLDRFNNDNSFIIGCNYGPAETKFYYELVSKIIERQKDVCFRDKWSYTKFSSLPNTRQTTDLLFTLKKYFPVRPKQTEKDKVFISVMDFQTSHTRLKDFADDYDSFIIEQIKNAIHADKEIFLASFCRNENDENAVDRILKKFTKEERTGIIPVKYDGCNETEILQNIADSSLVIATRFHSMIFGLLFGKPVIPVCYSNKHREFLKDIGAEEEKILSVEDLTEPQNEPEHFKLTEQQTEEFEKNAELQFSGFDRFIHAQT